MRRIVTCSSQQLLPGGEAVPISHMLRSIFTKHVDQHQTLHHGYNPPESEHRGARQFPSAAASAQRPVPPASYRRGADGPRDTNGPQRRRRPHGMRHQNNQQDEASRTDHRLTIDEDVEELVGAAKRNAGVEDEGPASSSVVDVVPQSGGRRATQTRFAVKLFDKFGVPAPPPKVPIGPSPSELAPLLPERLRKQLDDHCRRCNITAWTDPQRLVFPFILEGRDVLCIAPTAAGKTLAYLIPCLMQILTLGAKDGMAASGGDETGASNVDSTNIAALTRDRIAKGEVCKYCELDVFENPVCSFTGHPHRLPDPDSDEAYNRKAKRFSELTSLTEPKLLIVVPTAELAIQISNVARKLHCGYKISALHRFDQHSAAAMWKAFEGSDILISTPEPVLQALYKHKLSLRLVKAIVLDEVDELLSTKFFEQIKIILGALPKRVDRPQRLLFGATLPPPMHEMIRRDMLLASHRFVLASNPPTAVMGAGGGAVPPQPTQPIDDISGANSEPVASQSLTTHTVLMVAHVEKIGALCNLFHTGAIRGDQRTIVFCNSKANVYHVAEQLLQQIQQKEKPVRIVALSSSVRHAAREGIMKMFQSGVATVLVCTDLVGRGIDFHNVMYVVHYDMPLEIEQWVHRNGRCGRHGMKGFVYTMFQPEDVKLAKPVTALLRQSNQLVPPKLQDYARQKFIDIFKNSLFNHPTARHRRAVERHSPAGGRASPRIPDYAQQANNKHFRSR